MISYLIQEVQMNLRIEEISEKTKNERIFPNQVKTTASGDNRLSFQFVVVQLLE
jgi:hypothetical protein